MLFEEFGIVSGGLSGGRSAAARSMPKGGHSLGVLKQLQINVAQT
jgi:hypothetical protein